jgi:hypothetical protein
MVTIGDVRKLGLEDAKRVARDLEHRTGNQTPGLLCESKL